MKETVDLAGALYKIADILRWYERVTALPDCNNCRLRKTWLCDYLPKPGEMTRINCPHWEKGE